MKCFQIKKQYHSLLLLADEQEDMIDRNIDTGTMYVLEDNGIKAECIITDEGNGILKTKNNYDYPINECGVLLVDIKNYSDIRMSMLTVIIKYDVSKETLSEDTNEKEKNFYNIIICFLIAY